MPDMTQYLLESGELMKELLLVLRFCLEVCVVVIPCSRGALNNWIRKSQAAPWKSLTRIQHTEAQLKVVVKDGVEIGATAFIPGERPLKYIDRLTNGPFQGQQQHQQ